MEKKSILITGSAGFIGAAITKHLSTYASEYTIFHLSRSKEPTNIPDAKHVLLDLNNTDELAKFLKNNHINIIIHCAGKTGLSLKPQPFFEANVDVTENLLKSAKENKVETFIHFSSPSLFMSRSDQYDISEDSIFDSNKNFLTYYAKSKYESEQLVKNSTNHFKNTVIIRPATTYGVGAINLKNQMIKLIQGKRLFNFSSNEVLVDMCSIDNLVHAVYLIIKNLKKGHRNYHISDNQHISYIEILRNLFTDQKISFKEINMPFEVIYNLARFAEHIYKSTGQEVPPLINTYIVCNFGRSRTLSIQNLINDTGYSSKIDFKTGFNSFTQWALK